MKILIEKEIIPFEVPTFVRVVSKPGLKQDGFKESPKIMLNELDETTLNTLCKEFRDEVFRRAKKGEHHGN